MEIQAEEMTLPEIYKNITEGLTGNINVPDEKNIVKVITCSGNNILHLAAKSGQKQIAEDILNNYSSRDISLYHTNANDETPLHIASRLGHCELVKLFLDKKYHEDAEAAKVKLWKMRNKAGDTVLHEAVRNGHLETVKLLIEKDPDLMMMMTIAGVADAEESPLFVAVDRNYFEIALHMISEAKSEKISISGRNGKNALHAAIIRKVHKSHKDLVPNMLNKCPSSIEDRDNFGRIPLHYAAAKGNVKVVRLVLDKDSSLAYKKDNEGMCPLHIAANEGKKSVIKELLTRCPDSCELLDNKNRTSLHFAVQNKSYSTVEILLQTPGFQDLINVQDSEGNTAMHHASILGYVDIIMLLGQSKKVDKGAVNKAGMTVRDIILLKGLDKLDLFELVVMLRSGLWSSLDNFTIRSETTKMQNFDQKVKETAVPVPTSEAETEPAANGLIAARAKREKNNNSDHNATDESVKEMASVNLLVATIIASATFAAMFAMPGGYNDEGLAVANTRLQISHEVFIILHYSGPCVYGICIFVQPQDRLAPPFISLSTQ
ncbi:Ankyrin repeat-containing protein [Quillaja saponaria]|uniref:Ankyrin repeat-containing protein n=1 Tax=Quillaja saponaria TaxID=32244 RepID=A0AAD7LV21_QUISA|nr:Ankyrin repeat-containing protein [Quillaja saponaria]